MDRRPLAYEAYFFDLGGTLVAIENDEIYRDATGHVKLLDGVQATIATLHGMPLFVITNQAGVALGYLTEREARGYVAQVNDCLGGVITDYRLCMHHPEAGCSCRKPRPGMVLDLAQHYGIDLTRAILVGDAESDAQCAHAAGVGTFVWANAFFGRDSMAVGDAPMIL
jgi:D-glycero-D-manno-heptose 1,7-bisphosphate phosphatase